jgi:hypothetical protein
MNESDGDKPIVSNAMLEYRRSRLEKEQLLLDDTDKAAEQEESKDEEPRLLANDFSRDYAPPVLEGGLINESQDTRPSLLMPMTPQTPLNNIPIPTHIVYDMTRGSDNLQMIRSG